MGITTFEAMKIAKCKMQNVKYFENLGCKYVALILYPSPFQLFPFAFGLIQSFRFQVSLLLFE
jgi:hypothetical protein